MAWTQGGDNRGDANPLKQAPWPPSPHQPRGRVAESNRPCAFSLLFEPYCPPARAIVATRSPPVEAPTHLNGPHLTLAP